MSFVGKHSRQLDDRGRFVLPAKLRDKIEGVVYITKAPFENCLNLYTEQEWENIAEVMRQLPITTDEFAAQFHRDFFASADSFEVDKQGRIPLTEDLLNCAGLKKDIVLIGVNTKIEIWSAESFGARSVNSAENIREGMRKFNLNF